MGSRTCDREDLAKGLEPDQCYYIQNEALVRDVERIDLTQYPPPDLAVEIDITSSSLNRLAIYAALGVAELWRYDGSDLIVYGLYDGEYSQQEASTALPSLKAADLAYFLALRFPTGEAASSIGENSLLRQFRQWLRAQP